MVKIMHQSGKLIVINNNNRFRRHHLRYFFEQLYHLIQTDNNTAFHLTFGHEIDPQTQFHQKIDRFFDPSPQAPQRCILPTHPLQLQHLQTPLIGKPHASNITRHPLDKSTTFTTKASPTGLLHIFVKFFVITIFTLKTLR